MQNEFVIRENPTLSNITPFHSLEYIARLVIRECDAITNINFFPRLKTVDYRLNILNNNGIINLNGFNNLINLNSALIIEDNNGLVNLGGFEKLESIESIMVIQNNISMNTIEGFNNIKSIKGFVRIRYNDALESCCILPFIATAAKGSFTLEDNGNNCNDLEQIVNQCSITTRSNASKHTSTKN